jgi:DNA-binding Xre family transcriptional regulator
MDHNKKLSNIIKECGLSTKTVTKINNDENMELVTLAKVCLHLGIRVEDAVEFIKE